MRCYDAYTDILWFDMSFYDCLGFITAPDPILCPPPSYSIMGGGFGYGVQNLWGTEKMYGVQKIK